MSAPNQNRQFLGFVTSAPFTPESASITSTGIGNRLLPLLNFTLYLTLHLTLPYTLPYTLYLIPYLTLYLILYTISYTLLFTTYCLHFDLSFLPPRYGVPVQHHFANPSR